MECLCKFGISCKSGESLVDLFAQRQHLLEINVCRSKADALLRNVSNNTDLVDQMKMLVTHIFYRSCLSARLLFSLAVHGPVTKE